MPRCGQATVTVSPRSRPRHRMPRVRPRREAMRRGSGSLRIRALLVGAVALLVALPVLVLGQASENDTRTRLSAAQAESAAKAVSAVTITVNDRYENVRSALVGLALKPKPEDSLVGLAMQRGDTA